MRNKNGMVLKYCRTSGEMSLVGSPLTGLPCATISDLAILKSTINSNIILAAASEHGVFKTDNGGKTWEPCNNGIDLKYGKASRFVIVPKNPNIIYLLYGSISLEHFDDKSAYGCIYKSDDYGDSWKKIFPSKDIFADVRCMWIDPKDHMKMLIGIQQRKNKDGVSFYPCGIYYSENEGKSWELVLKNALPTDFVYDPVSGTIFLSCSTGSDISSKIKYMDLLGMGELIHPGLFASKDGGHSWKDISGEMDNITGSFENLAINVENREIYLGTHGGVFKANIQELIRTISSP
jgi:hypothetical protein